MCTRLISPACRPTPFSSRHSRLPGRKIVHTNGSQRHAERLLDHLGIAGSFCGVVDIVAPVMIQSRRFAGYHELLRRHEVSPGTALMVEDIAKTWFRRPLSA